VQEHLPGLAELGVEDEERSRFQVDIVPSEAARFALAHAGHGQQPDQRPPCRCPHRRREPVGGVHERGDFPAE
jgi:hypothetical protein